MKDVIIQLLTWREPTCVFIHWKSGWKNADSDTANTGQEILRHPGFIRKHGMDAAFHMKSLQKSVPVKS